MLKVELGSESVCGLGFRSRGDLLGGSVGASEKQETPDIFSNTTLLIPGPNRNQGPWILGSHHTRIVRDPKTQALILIPSPVTLEPVSCWRGTLGAR